jgi:hypothetical protein
MRPTLTNTSWTYQWSWTKLPNCRETFAKIHEQFLGKLHRLFKKHSTHKPENSGSGQSEDVSWTADQEWR